LSAGDTLLLAIADRVGHGVRRQAELDRDARRTRFLVDVNGTPGSHPKPRRAMSSKKRARSVDASRT